MKILVVEDDPEAADYVVESLADEGHAVTVASDGFQGLAEAVAGGWDLLVVDRMLPHLDGANLVRQIRDKGLETPVLFLTALGTVNDRVTGLNAGGDDYLVKPFALEELIARINAIARRRPRASITHLRISDLEMDLLSRTVRCKGKPVELQAREFLILEYLMKHSDQIVTRRMLLENVWRIHFDPETNVVESHLSRLRSKLAQVGMSEFIQTIRGSGYCIRESA